MAHTNISPILSLLVKQEKVPPIFLINLCIHPLCHPLLFEQSKGEHSNN